MSNDGGHKLAMFAAGCFWGVEEAFRQLPGVVQTEVGYSGGHVENPGYERVCSDTTGHAEVVRVEYDPERISYGQLLYVFWQSHDPTQLNRQGPDVGSQYRSAVFYYDDRQEEEATRAKQLLQNSGRYDRPVVTEITSVSPFYRAEEYHQRYLQKRGQSFCHS